MALVQNFKSFAEAGIKATPVPGTSKYLIQFQDGSSVYVNERTLFRLLDSGESTESIIRILREQTPFSNYPERYKNLLRANQR
ncbi:hypothetical protein [Desulfofundulus thermosubterraneus]|uniref:Uncharacterized protein n=1 Tax=Desulfofundulus thermosubterraneus DSM 16057 TaxID=1121432 RepID=A0A1M6J164_9FIRM|nr:hypothetical protein [Desulfofundulus thermosubterraneus]SHJ40407.1 hypothetical protein SAMN02745219_02482 [Desulfofundulus thermosubterraneus DSM 16057]